MRQGPHHEEKTLTSVTVPLRSAPLRPGRATPSSGGRSNAGTGLPTSAEGIASQNLAPEEVVVIDNASADGTPGWVRASYPAVRVIENPVNVGFARACNQALALAFGQYVLFLNPDTRLKPGALESMIQRLRQEPRPGLLSPRLQGGGPPAWGRFPTLGRLAARRLGARPEPEPCEGPVDWVLGACMLGPAEVVRELGGFDDDYFLYGEDLDLCDRMAAAGRTVVYYPLVTVTHLGNDRWDPDRLERVHGAVLMFFKKRRSLVSYLAVWIGLRLLKLWRGGESRIERRE